MPTGRALRFVLEVALLVGLAVPLGLAGVRPAAIVAVMALAWLIVVLVEWVAWHDVPHYGSGLPPRYYLPPSPLPPPRPIEQSRPPAGYPRQETATWIASADLRAEVLGAWPVAVPTEIEVDVAGLEPEPVAVAAPVPVPTDVAAARALEAERAEPEFAPLGAEDDPWHVQQLPSERFASDGEQRLATHRLDPFAEPARRGLRRRRPLDTVVVVELPVLPRHMRPPRPESFR